MIRKPAIQHHVSEHRGILSSGIHRLRWKKRCSVWFLKQICCSRCQKRDRPRSARPFWTSCAKTMLPCLLLANNVKEVFHYTAEELAQFRKSFKPALERYRSDSIWFFPGYFALLFGSILIGPCPGWIKVFPGLALVVGVFLLVRAISGANPKCPACGGELAGAIGCYCPECGAREVQPARGVFAVPRCNTCKKELRSGKHRGHKICVCTHCGVRLLDEGM